MNSTIRAYICVPVLLLVMSCSSQGDLPGSRAGNGTRGEYGEDEKRIARLLSIGEAGVQLGESPHDAALLCDIALQTMSDQLRQSGVLSEEQMRALGKMQALYRQRAAKGRSAAQTATARRGLETGHADAAERVRLAIGCLRDLEN